MMESEHDAKKRLPPEIYELALRAGSDANRPHSLIRLRQTGRMRRIATLAG